jgi:NAD(P)-dependent dehydrogenase (short-subunit alcohol dehydrogenase family)
LFMHEKTTRTVANKRVLVTAGASGIGLAIAQAFAAEQAEVMVCDQAAERIEGLGKISEPLEGVMCDVSNPDDVDKLFQRVRNRWGGQFDVLINNAGIAGPHAPIEKIAWSDWQQTMTVNVGGMFLCIQAAIPLWRATGAGAVVNISSTSAKTGLVDRLPYVVSKAAVHGLTLNVARELGPLGVSCNAILPGVVDNERGRHFISMYAKENNMTYEQALSENLRYISMRAVVSPQEVAAMCLHLASPAGRYISGQLIGVCGNAEWE